MALRPLVKFIFCIFIFPLQLLANQDSVRIVEFFNIVDSAELTKENRSAANDSITHILTAFLNTPDSFNKTIGVERIGKVSSEDGRLNIYTWNFKIDPVYYGYGGMVQYINDKEDTVLIKLSDKQNEIPIDKYLEPNEWYGCLYYDVVVKKKRRQTYYTVLGWDGYNDLMARKMIDVFSFSKSGELTLGDNIFKMKNGRQKRVLFRFSASGSMVLVYDKKYKRIIFDHLSPARPDLEGQYEYYGSDFSYDGLKFKRRTWEFEELIDPRNRD